MHIIKLQLIHCEYNVVSTFLKNCSDLSVTTTGFFHIVASMLYIPMYYGDYREDSATSISHL